MITLKSSLKKTATIALSALMAFSSFPLAAYAEGETTESSTDTTETISETSTGVEKTEFDLETTDTQPEKTETQPEAAPEEAAEDVQEVPTEQPVETTADTLSLIMDVAGNDTVFVSKNGETEAYVGGDSARYTISYVETDNLEVITPNASYFVVWKNDGTTENYNGNVNYTVQPQDAYISVGQGLQAQQRSGRRRRSTASLDTLEVGDTFSGTLGTSNTNADIGHQTFTIDYIDGLLGGAAGQILNNLAVYCLEPGYIGLTYRTDYELPGNPKTYYPYNATVTAVQPDGRVTIHIDVPRYLNPYTGAEATGWNAQLGTVPYQRCGADWVIQTAPRKKMMYVAVHKKNGNPKLTAGNSCYAQDLSGAVYGVYRDANATDKITEITTDAEGKVKSEEFELAPNATKVYIKEIKAPKGFALDPKVYPVEYGGDSWTIDSVDMPMNDPLTIKLDKITSDGDVVANPASLEGAEFTIKYYDGQFTMNNLPTNAERTWVIKTVKNAKGKYIAALDREHFISGSELFTQGNDLITLPLGTITVEETKAPVGYTLKNKTLSAGGQEVANGIALFNIVDENSTAVLKGGNEYTVQEEAIRGGVEIQKKDAANGNNVGTAQFVIVNKNDFDVVARSADGSVLGSAAAGKEISYTITTDANGYWKSSENFLPAGKYELKEKASPTGYYLSSTNTAFEIKTNKAFVSTEMKDEQIEARIIKVDERGRRLAGAELALYDLTEDPNANAAIKTWTTTTEPEDVSSILKAGHMYRIIETDADDSYYIGKPVDFQVPETKPAESITVTFDNQHIDYMIAKVDAETGEYMDGVIFKITDTTEDREIAMIVTTDAPQAFNLFKRGHSYKVEEVSAPKGYYVAEPVEFTVATEVPDQTPVTVTIKDDRIHLVVQKTDTDGHPLADVKLTVIDKESGQKIDEWKTVPDEKHEIGDKVEAGKTYILRETESIQGYYYSADIEFTVDEKNPGKTVEVTMVDEAIKLKVKKTDSDGHPLADVKLEVIEKETGKQVAQWQTVPDEEHELGDKLEAGKTYILKETETIQGYYYSEDIEFTVGVLPPAEAVTVTMKDAAINYQIAKVNERGEYVKGVKLKLEDTTDADNPVEIQLPNGGVTTAEPFKLEKVLEAEHTYKLTELESVDGLAMSEAITFNVARIGTDEVVTITMKDLDNGIIIEKVDNHGNPVSGAKLQVIEKDSGNVVFAYTTGDVPADISKVLKGGVTYVLHEVEAPVGFEPFKDIEFKAEGTSQEKQLIRAVDTRKVFYVAATKVDAMDSTKKLKGAELTLFKADGTVALDKDGKECKGLTDGEGVIVWAVEYAEDMGGYYVQETAAPEGYRINDEHHKVTLSEDYDFALGNPVKIVVNDLALPSVKTADTFNAAGFLMMFVGSMLAAVFFYIKKKQFAE